MALTILDLYKVLPKSNCGKCGLPTCLAFAAQVISQGEKMGKCPDLSVEARSLEPRIQEQQLAQGKRPDSLSIALEFLQKKVAALDFSALANGLGAAYGEETGRPYLRLSYFGDILHVFKDEIRYPAGINGNPWDAILLYNYIASKGNRAPTRKWITFDSLPNSVSKTKTLNRIGQKLASHFSSRPDLIRDRVAGTGGTIIDEEGDADLKVLFWPLPRVPILMLFWHAIEQEHFSAQCHILFDTHVMSYLDLESLLFLAEQLQERLILE